MAKARQGIEFPIIPEDLVFSDDDLSPDLQNILFFTNATSELQDSIENENSIAPDK
jgi:hypothetical protein